MYNRYIPSGMAYTRVLEQDAPPFYRPGVRKETARRPEPAPPLHGLGRQAPPPQGEPRGTEPVSDAPEEKGSLLSGLLKSLHLGDLDTGDILLLLILLFLVLDGDGDNLELIITLGLVVLFSLGGKDGEKGGAAD